MATLGVSSIQQPAVVGNGYQVMDPKPNYSQRYSSRGGMGTGVVQVLCGVIVFILGIVSHTLSLTWSIASTGIWSGLGFFVLSGLLGIISSRRQTSVVVGYMVMSILSAIIAFFAGCTYAYVIFGVRVACPVINPLLADYGDEIPDGIINCTNPNVDSAVNGTLAVMFFIEFLAAIVGSGFTCGGVCCNSEPTVSTTHLTVVTNQPMDAQGGWPAQQGFNDVAPPPSYMVQQSQKI